jgi:hypothetical protein
MNINFSESLETVFWVKMFKFFDADPGSGIRDLFNIGSGIRNPGWKNSVPGSGIKYPGSTTLRSGY